jgi:hypothetical protein
MIFLQKFDFSQRKMSSFIATILKICEWQQLKIFKKLLYDSATK